MSVVVRHHAPGMTADQYSAIADVTMADLQSAKGFIAHYAFLEGDGLTVSEIWDTQADHDAFFNEHIRPKLPQEIPTPAVFEVLNAATAMTFVGGAARTAGHAAGHAAGVLGGAAGRVWSWTRGKLGELTHRSEKAEAGPGGESASTTTPGSEPAPPEAPPVAKGGATGEATAKPTPAEAAPAQSATSKVPTAKGGATGKAKSAPSTGNAGGTSA